MKPPEAVPLAGLLAEGAGILSEAGIDDPRRRARQIVMAVAGIDAADILRETDMELSRDTADEIRDVFRRCSTGEPLTRILGRREFWGHEFALSPATLDPRPDTETVISAALEIFPDRSAPLVIADLGTGTGAIALTLLGEYENATALATDRSVEALATARKNASALQVASRAQFLAADWLATVAGQFDLIVSNPPYIRSEDIPGLDAAVSLHDPLLALDGGADGLTCYKAILANAAACIRPGGWLLFEIGIEMEAAVVAAAEDRMKIAETRFWRDLAGIVRVVGIRPDVSIS